MNHDPKKALRDELRERVRAGMEAGLDPEEIRTQPRTQRFLGDLFPVDDLVVAAHRAIIRGVIAEFKNDKGERAYVYVEQRALDGVLQDTDELPSVGVEARWAPLEKVKAQPPMKRAALLKLLKLLKGAVRNAGFVEPETRVEVLEALDTTFARLMA